MTVQISVHLSDDLHQKLSDETSSHHISKSEFIEQAITEKLED